MNDLSIERAKVNIDSHRTTLLACEAYTSVGQRPYINNKEQIDLLTVSRELNKPKAQIENCKGAPFAYT